MSRVPSKFFFFDKLLFMRRSSPVIVTAVDVHADFEAGAPYWTGFTVDRLDLRCACITMNNAPIRRELSERFMLAGTFGRDRLACKEAPERSRIDPSRPSMRTSQRSMLAT